MIDMHNHLIYGIDDGSKAIDDSVKIIEKLNELGFNKIVATPHYIKDTLYDKNNEIKKQLLKNIKNNLDKKINVSLYLGNEIFINEEIGDLILNNNVSTINGSKYLLIEFPMFSKLSNIDDYLFELKRLGYVIILAHPERYVEFQKDKKKLIKLYEEGILFQANYGSIIEEYGKSAKKLVIYLLKNNMVTFLSTDTHRYNSLLINNFKKAKNKIIKIIGEDNFNKLSNYNIEKVLNNEDLF